MRVYFGAQGLGLGFRLPDCQGTGMRVYSGVQGLGLGFRLPDCQGTGARSLQSSPVRTH